MTEKLHKVAVMVENVNREDSKHFKRKKVKTRKLRKTKKIILIGGEMQLRSSKSHCPISVKNMQITYKLGKNTLRKVSGLNRGIIL